MPHLEHLNLSYNQIVSIDPQAFNGTPNFKFIDLTNNKIKQLSLQVFKGFNRAHELHLLLLGNPISEYSVEKLKKESNKDRNFDSHITILY